MCKKSNDTDVDSNSNHHTTGDGVVNNNKTSNIIQLHFL